MRVFTSSILFLLSGVSWVCCVQTLNGSVGKSVEIRCEYPQEYDPMSVYLMKMSNRETVIELTKAHGKTYTKGRYSLYHDSESRVIVASIHNLIMDDAGTYRCASASMFDDDDKDYRYTEFRLEVEQAPPTSKPPLITGSTSAHSSPTGDTHSSRNTRAPELESTSVQGNSNTTQSGQNASLYGGLAAAVLVGLLVLTIILMKTRVKRRETPRSSLRNPSNAEENNCIYAEIQDTDSSAETAVHRQQCR
ncbi:CMRF35-like molecule 8 [Alosa pseudoharengus]|uniref:CMRF35-like molecule 8 n=1 Tax=Alosa pseudoharengus TaxID=34774 RepID=UPI003F8C13C0